MLAPEKHFHKHLAGDRKSGSPFISRETSRKKERKKTRRRRRRRFEPEINGVRRRTHFGIRRANSEVATGG